MSRTLIHGRIPQAWDLKWLSEERDFNDRLAKSPDASDAEFYRERAERFASAIKEIEANG